MSEFRNLLPAYNSAKKPDSLKVADTSNRCLVMLTCMIKNDAKHIE